MRLSEIAAPTRIFFHGSLDALELGTILRPGVGGYVLSRLHFRLTERAMAHYRPTACIPRTRSIFMVDNPDPRIVTAAGGNDNFIYRVEAMDAVERNDAGWWDMIARDVRDHYQNGVRLADLLPRYEEWAEAYWAGEKCPHEDYPWEYRTRRARVLEEVYSTERGSNRTRAR